MRPSFGCFQGSRSKYRNRPAGIPVPDTFDNKTVIQTMEVRRLGSGTQVVVKWGKGILLRGEGQVKAVETNLLKFMQGTKAIHHPDLSAKI